VNGKKCGEYNSANFSAFNLSIKYCAEILPTLPIPGKPSISMGFLAFIFLIFFIVVSKRTPLRLVLIIKYSFKYVTTTYFLEFLFINDIMEVIEKPEIEICCYDIEEAIDEILDALHARVEGLKKYKKISEKNEKIKYFLFGAYTQTSRWQHSSNWDKNEFKKKIQAIGEDYIGTIALDQMKENKYPEDTETMLYIYDELIYNEDFLIDLIQNSSKIHSIMTGDSDRHYA